MRASNPADTQLILDKIDDKRLGTRPGEVLEDDFH